MCKCKHVYCLFMFVCVCFLCVCMCVFLVYVRAHTWACVYRFYLGKHSGRQLTLQPHLGSADLIAFFYGQKRDDPADSAAASSSKPVAPRKHILQVSTYQMCILLLFNNRDKWTYEVSSDTHVFHP